MTTTTTPLRTLVRRRLAPLAGAVALVGGTLGVAVVTATPTSAQVAPCVATAVPNPVAVGVPYTITVTGLGDGDTVDLLLTDPGGDTVSGSPGTADGSGTFVFPQDAAIEGEEGTWNYAFTGTPSGAACSVDVVIIAAPTTTTTAAPTPTTAPPAVAAVVTPAFTG